MNHRYFRQLKKPISDQLKSRLETQHGCKIVRSTSEFSVGVFYYVDVYTGFGEPLSAGLALLLDIELSEYIIS